MTALCDELRGCCEAQDCPKVQEVIKPSKERKVLSGLLDRHKHIPQLRTSQVVQDQRGLRCGQHYCTLALFLLLFPQVLAVDHS